MIDKELLKERIKESGFKLSHIAEKLSITRASLHNKLTGKRSFSVAEVLALSEILSLSREERDSIFFSPFVDK